MKFSPGDLVIGKNKSLLGKRGRIILVEANGRSTKNRVVWDDNTEGEYFTKALDPNRGGATLQAPQQGPNNENNAILSPSTASIDGEGEEEGDSAVDVDPGNLLRPYELPPYIPPPNHGPQTIYDEDEQYEEYHILTSLSTHAKYSETSGNRLKCKHCGHNTSQYCKKCSFQNPDGTYYIYACCNPFIGTRGQPRLCYFDHLKKC